jgi:hypothetical protein
MKYNMQKQVMNLENFKKDVLHRIIFRFYNEGEFPTAENLTLELRDKTNCSGSVSLICKIL